MAKRKNTTDAEALFAFEHAERILDAFADDARMMPLRFRRAYRKFKYMLAAYAYVDHDMRRSNPKDRRKALAYAWEDAQIAFVGRGEPALTGAIVGMWANLRGDEERNEFAEAVAKAFAAAEAATPASAPRRYLSEWRLAPVRRPEEGFNLGTVLPTRGEVLRDWALDEGDDPDDVEQEWYWLELADRDLESAPAPEKELSLKAGSAEPAVPNARAHLKLVVNRDRRVE